MEALIVDGERWAGLRRLIEDTPSESISPPSDLFKLHSTFLCIRQKDGRQSSYTAQGRQLFLGDLRE